MVQGCNAAAQSHQVGNACELGEEDPVPGEGRQYGKKLEDVITLIKSIPEDDQVLLFVQFDDLMEKIASALRYHKISHYAITEKSTRPAVSWVTDFQQNKTDKKKKVLVLNPAAEISSGLYVNHPTLSFPHN